MTKNKDPLNDDCPAPRQWLERLAELAEKDMPVDEVEARLRMAELMGFARSARMIIKMNDKKYDRLSQM